MSSTAIKDVTHMLRRLLEVAIKGSGFLTPKVTTLPPSTDLPNEQGANLYLYRVIESPFTKNQDWRGDRKPTLPSTRPALGLQLFYLITPLSKKETIDGDDINRGEEAHSILGAIMLALQENPILNDVHLPTLDADLELPPSIRDSFEQVKVTLLPTDVNELSKIWATINQPYRLSVAYEVSIVELTPTPPPSVVGGIVLSTGVHVITLDPPRLTALDKPADALVLGDADELQRQSLTIHGSGLSFPRNLPDPGRSPPPKQIPIVRIGGKPVTLVEAPVPTDQAITVLLPTDLEAGPNVDVSVTLNSRTSTPLTFTVSPWLVRTTPLRIALDSASVDADRQLNLEGNGVGPEPLFVRFENSDDGRREVPNQPITVTVLPTGIKMTATIPTTLGNGLYAVRLVNADGTASNRRPLEILPLVGSPKVVSVDREHPETEVPTTNAKAVHKLIVNGQRLNGSDIRFVLDGVTYSADKNEIPDQFVFVFGRLLTPGTHRLELRVDGHISRSVPLVVP